MQHGRKKERIVAISLQLQKPLVIRPHIVYYMYMNTNPTTTPHLTDTVDINERTNPFIIFSEQVEDEQKIDALRQEFRTDDDWLLDMAGIFGM